MQEDHAGRGPCGRAVDYSQHAVAASLDKYQSPTSMAPDALPSPGHAGRESTACPPATESATHHTALAHLYRGEVNRMTVWRGRLDITTHWAIILSIGLTTFALGSPSVPHYVMLLVLASNTIFMFIEGRRYQHLHHSKWRVNLLEHNYFAPLLSGDGHVEEANWRAQLATDLRRPHFTLGLVMATRLRLRRNYLMVMLLVTAVWVVKLLIHPSSPADFADLFARLSVQGFLPSWLVASTAAVFVVGMSVLAALTPSEEALERWSSEEHFRLTAGTRGRPPRPEGRAGRTVSRW